MQNPQRALTASPLSRQRHQISLLKEIKTLQHLEKQQNSSKFKSCHQTPTPSRKKLKRKKKTQHFQSPLYEKIGEIEKIRGLKKKPIFSFNLDQKNICEQGWQDFGQKVDRQTHTSLHKVRQKVRNLQKRATVSTICIKNEIKPSQAQNSTIGEQKIKDIWDLAKGGKQTNDRYFRLTDFSKAVKSSVILNNAYHTCLHSKVYSASSGQAMKGQKLKSYVYLNENRHKLPQKKMNQIMKNNYFLS